MAREDFEKIFLRELSDLYDAENQLVIALPKAIKAANTQELKDALEHHFEETKNQVKRLDKIFSRLHTTPQRKSCDAMKGLVKEMDKLLAEQNNSIVRDAEIIAIAQRIEHYEIAGYGVARSFATQLDYNDEADLLTATLEEEGAADKKLTSIAEGGLFSLGINIKAQSE